MALNIVLVEPEIPQNTGNIARTCAITGTRLHLVRPLGFKIDNKHLKRAGLDYWDLLEIYYYDSFDQVLKENSNGTFYYATTKAKKLYVDYKYEENSFFVFGKETKGLSDDIIFNGETNLIKIPMKKDLTRSLNLANSVNIILFEAFRQIEFPYYKR